MNHLLICTFLTIQNVNDDCLGVGVGGVAGVLARIGRVSSLYQEVAYGNVAFLSDHRDTSSRRVVVDLIGVVSPKYGRGRLWAVLHYAREIDGTTLVDVHLWAAEDCCYWFWKKIRWFYFLIYYTYLFPARAGLRI